MVKMMDDLISRTKALGLAKDLIIDNKDGTLYRYRCIDPDVLAELPSEGPKQETGEWIPIDNKGVVQIWECSKCGETTYSSMLRKPRYRFCPMCGRKMKCGEDETNLC